MSTRQLASPFLSTLLLTGLVLLCPPTLLAAVDINQSLVVNDVVFTAATGNLAFAVQNKGSKDLVAYIVDVTYLFPDGHKTVIPYLHDHTLELPMMGHVVAAPPDVHIGLIAPMQTESCHFAFSSSPDQGKIVSVTVVPVAAIFDDNAVAGDASRARLSVFRPHQALSSIYQQYVAMLQAIGPDADIRIQADALRQKYSSAGDGADTLGVDPDTYNTIARSTYKQIGHYLNRLISRIDSGRRPPKDLLAAQIADARELETAYRTHSTPLQ
jgi:hypothetical protein